MARRPQRLDEPRQVAAQLVIERHAGEMCADHGDRDTAVARRWRERRQRRLRPAECAERQRGVGMEAPADGGEQAVLAAGREQSDAERSSGIMECGGNGQSAQSRRELPKCAIKAS